MAHHTLVARINSGDGKFPFVNVQFSRNHRPIPIENATYYLRPSSGGKRTPIRVGKDVGATHTTLIRIENGERIEEISSPLSGRRFENPKEIVERSKQKSRKTYLGYRTAVNLFVSSCKKIYFDEICRDDILDFLHELRTRPSRERSANRRIDRLQLLSQNYRLFERPRDRQARRKRGLDTKERLGRKRR
jgi:hypothetical protein